MTIAPPAGTDPHDLVMRLALGHVAARALVVLVELQIPDHLADRPRPAAELATLTGVDPDALLRLLRAATALDVCTEGPDLHFALTSAGEALRADAPRHAATAIRQLGNGPVWGAVADMGYSVATGHPALARAGGAPLFRAVSPDQAARFSDAMLAYYGDEPAAVAAAYEFSDVDTVVDVGGGGGNLITTLLLATPGLRGILHDLPALAPHAGRTIAARGLADRCTFIGGDFFSHVPGGGDMYLLSHVINDWPVDQCRDILRSIRKVIPRHGRVLIIEQLIARNPESDRAKLLDLISLTVSGGRHRTADEHAVLLASAGFRQTGVYPTSTRASIVEGRPA